MFKYDGEDLKLHNAVDLANNIELMNYVKTRILSSPNYDYSDTTNNYIAIRWCEYLRFVKLNIVVYYPKYRWSKSYGYFTPDRPTDININGYKIEEMTTQMLVSLFYHESGHSWNESDPDVHVHHGNNNSTGKENTFMYSMNRYVYKFFNYEYKPNKLPWYKKLFNFLKWW